VASISNRQVDLDDLPDSEERIAELRKQVAEIADGQAFKGSDRCGKFLKYIVDEVIAGRSEALKERVIGVEVFGRSPSYDTSEDAIVRVTATDVRKRLLRHYGRNGSASRFHIGLPVGSYVPEIICEGQSSFAWPDGQQVHPFPEAKVPSLGGLEQARGLASIAGRNPVIALPGASIAETVLSETRFKRRWLAFALLILVLNVSIWGIFWKRDLRAKARASEVQATPASVVPWSALFSSQHPTHLITSDTDIGKIQKLTRSRISVSDYISGKYISEHKGLSPAVKQVVVTMMPGDDTPSMDTQFAVNVAELAMGSSKKIDVQYARSLQFATLKTDDNFIFLGSPYSDPWVSLFNDQLDFRIIGDKDFVEIIRNSRPTPGEQTLYVPTTKGGATGESYAIIALVGNPDQYGQVLLLAGLSAAGTRAAGTLVTDLPRLSAALQKCGIPPSGPLEHFEMLLRVNTMAGHSSQFDVVACHILRDTFH
jgi:hypothetical protein